MAKSRGSDWNLGFVGQRLGYQLHRADMLHMQLIREALAGLGLTPARATALAIIHENPGCSQNDLGSALSINRASAMELTNSLVGLGAVERQQGLDRRTHALYLTAKGERLFQQFADVSSQVDEVIAAGLSAADRATLAESLALISDSLEQALAQRGDGDAAQEQILEVQ